MHCNWRKRTPEIALFQKLHIETSKHQKKLISYSILAARINIARCWNQLVTSFACITQKLNWMMINDKLSWILNNTFNGFIISRGSSAVQGLSLLRALFAYLLFFLLPFSLFWRQHYTLLYRLFDVDTQERNSLQIRILTVKCNFIGFCLYYIT